MSISSGMFSSSSVVHPYVNRSGFRKSYKRRGNGVYESIDCTLSGNQMKGPDRKLQ